MKAHILLGIRHFGRFGTHCRLLLSFAISVYGVWFWSAGISGGLVPVTGQNYEPKPCHCYPLHTFFFAQVLVYDGWVRYVYIVSSTRQRLDEWLG